MSRNLDHETGVSQSASRSRRPVAPAGAPDLFAAAVLAVPTREILGMVRGGDPLESQAAAIKASMSRHDICERILGILAHDGPLTARDLEQRPEFAGVGRSTVSARCSDLKIDGRAVIVGRRDGSALLDLAPLTASEAPSNGQ